MGSLAGKVAIVTGGSRGIGLAVARALAAQRMNVVLVARGEERLREAAAELDGGRAGVLAVPADVSDGLQVDDLIRQTLGRFDRIDVLVNNAGIGNFAPLRRVKEADWDETIAVNLKGAFLCCRAVLTTMKKQRSGHIVNICSMGAKLPKAGWGPYNASKGGMLALAGTLTEEVGSRNIKVTSLCPEYVDTARSQGARESMIKTADIAETVLYVLRLSDHAHVREILISNT